jgi:ATP-dependent Clp protease adapter protein ClpS
MSRLISLALLFVILLSACATTPAPTQTVTPLPPTPTSTLTLTPTQTLTPTPTPYRVFMLSEMTLAGGPEQCDVNQIILDSPTYTADVRTMIVSVEAQMPNPNSDGVGFRLHTTGDPFVNKGIYDQLTLLFQSGDGVSTLPFATCGDLVMGENHARITVFFIPWFEADHPMIPITIATEHSAESIAGPTIFMAGGQAEYDTYYSNNAVFATMKSGDPSIQFMINVDNSGHSQAYFDQQQERIQELGFFITEQIHGVPGFEQFSKDWIDVWTNNNRDPIVLQRIREFLHENIVGGKIRTD